jgi:DNA replication and repair protein RecF
MGSAFVYLEQVSLANFRNYVAAELDPAPEGITLLQGDNGAGKTNILEAIGYAATLRSFRGAPTGALVRSGDQQAVVRARANREGRNVLVEIELNLVGKDKARLNRQAVRRNEDLLGALLTTVFSPDDIEIVKGGPQSRREYMDDLLAALHPRYGATRAELERVLRQRNALLRSANGVLRQGMAPTLDVWDTKLAAVGEDIAEARGSLVVSLQPEVGSAYNRLSATGERTEPGPVALRYERSWEGPLVNALQESRVDDLRRGVTTVGPQRDDLYLGLAGMAARLQASQGEQRSVALALRLGGHALVTERQGSSPVLLLDDIFSELDPGRSAALAGCLPPGQALLTAAGAVPPGLPVSRCARVHHGSVGSCEQR